MIMSSIRMPVIQTEENCNHNNGNMAELPSDILEEVITNLPTVHLLAASCVSSDWLQAVRSSLLRRPRDFPWLVLRRKSSSSCSIHALDPYSGTWLSTCTRPVNKQPSGMPMPHFLCGSNRSRLYRISPLKMAVFKGPFDNACRMEAEGPKVWRQDPVVGEVGWWIVVAGGGFVTDSDDEEGAVEDFDKHTGNWEQAQPMPWKFKGSTYATWLSAAASGTGLYVIERKTGWLSRFDLESKKWGTTRRMLPQQLHPDVSSCCIATMGNERLLLVGMGRREESQRAIMTVKLWEIDGDSLRTIDNVSEEIPDEMANRLFPDFDCLDGARQRACSVQVHGTERGGYMFDPANMKHGVVMYRLAVQRKLGRMVENWQWMPCPAAVEDRRIEEVSVGCFPVTLNELACYFV